MKLTTRSRYGVRFMLDLALHASEGPVQLGVVARRQGIDLKYLEQIALPLKKADYVKSVRGPRGGHLLGRPPEEISLAGVVSLLEGGLKLTDCITHAGVCERWEHCVTRVLWAEASEAVLGKLEAISLRDLMNRVPCDGGAKECEDEKKKP